MKRVFSAAPDKFEDSSQTNRLCANLCHLRHDSQLTDIRLQTEQGADIACHRVVLAAGSNYFQAMLCSGFNESKSDSVVIHGVEHDALVAVVDYLYTGTLSFPTDLNLLQCIVQACDIFQLNAAKSAGEKRLLRLVDNSNAASLYGFSKMFHLCSLQCYCLSRMCAIFPSLSTTEEFLLLTSEDLCELLGNTELQAPNEDAILTAALSWVKHDLTERQKYLPELLTKIKLVHCSEEFLKCDTLHNIPGCEKLVQEALEKESSTSAESTERISYTSEESLCLLGGQSGPFSTLKPEDYVFNEDANSWSQVGVMPLDIQNLFNHQQIGFSFSPPKLKGSASQDKVLMVAEQQGSLKGLWLCQQSIVPRWTSLPLPGFLRKNATYVLHGTEIYMLSGYRGNMYSENVKADDYMCSTEVLSSQERRTWQRGPEMLHGGHRPVTASSGSQLCVFTTIPCLPIATINTKDGGVRISLPATRRTQIMDSVTGTWSPGADPPDVKFECCTAVAVYSCVYMLAADVEHSALHKYDLVRDQWTQLCPPPCHREDMGVVAWKGQILIGGGRAPTEIGHRLSSNIDVYDPDKNEWKEWSTHLPSYVVSPNLFCVRGRRARTIAEKPEVVLQGI